MSDPSDRPDQPHPPASLGPRPEVPPPAGSTSGGDPWSAPDQPAGTPAGQHWPTAHDTPADGWRQPDAPGAWPQHDGPAGGWDAPGPYATADPSWAGAQAAGAYPGMDVHEMFGAPPGSGPYHEPVPAPASKPNRTPRRFGATVLAFALLAGAAGGGLTAALVEGGNVSTAASATSASAAADVVASGAPTIIAKVEPALVNILAVGTSSSSTYGGSEETEAAGTGMIVSSDGLVVTNAHVIAGATSISVVLNGTTKAIPATFVGEDAAKDIAVIKITGESNLPTVSFGNSSKVVSGDSVLAIGNALNLKTGAFTASDGIISGLDRSVSTDNGENLTGMLQTSAAISSGDSGGPLVNGVGQVIGMDTATAASSTENTAENIGFSIPSNEITSLLTTLEKGSIGTPTYGSSSSSSSSSSGTNGEDPYGSSSLGSY